MTKRWHTPSTSKMRRRELGFKRKGDGQHQERIRRPDPRRLHVEPTEKDLTGVAGLAPFGAFVRELGVDGALHRRFFRLKTGRSVIYPMAAQMRLLMDTALAGEERVFGIEALAVDPLFVRLAGGVVPSITYFDDHGLRAIDPESPSIDRLVVRRFYSTNRCRKGIPCCPPGSARSAAPSAPTARPSVLEQPDDDGIPF
jgi:hypothetical protein